MSKRDIDLALPVSTPFFKLQISGDVSIEDDVLKRVLALILVHSDPDNTYTLDGLHPQELISRATTNGIDGYLERLNIIGGTLVEEINADLVEDDADPSEALSSIIVAARDGESATAPRIVIEIIRVTGERTQAELRPHE